MLKKLDVYESTPSATSIMLNSKTLILQITRNVTHENSPWMGNYSVPWIGNCVL